MWKTLYIISVWGLEAPCSQNKRFASVLRLFRSVPAFNCQLQSVLY